MKFITYFMNHFNQFIKKAVRNKSFNQVFYSTHTLNLVISIGFDENNDIKSILGQCRKMVGNFKSSSSATNRLHEIQEKINIPPL